MHVCNIKEIHFFFGNHIKEIHTPSTFFFQLLLLRSEHQAQLKSWLDFRTSWFTRPDLITSECMIFFYFNSNNKKKENQKKKEKKRIV